MVSQYFFGYFEFWNSRAFCKINFEFGALFKFAAFSLEKCFLIIFDSIAKNLSILETFSSEQIKFHFLKKVGHTRPFFIFFVFSILSIVKK